jgi:hypothetical protein
MADDFHKPTQYSGDKFDTYEGGEDPAQILRVAHDTAHALVNRARENDDPEVLDRLIAYTDEHGIDAIAELWARSSPRSLPGALWRIYLVRLLIRQDPAGTTRSGAGFSAATFRSHSIAPPPSAGFAPPARQASRMTRTSCPTSERRSSQPAPTASPRPPTSSRPVRDCNAARNWTEKTTARQTGRPADR